MIAVDLIQHRFVNRSRSMVHASVVRVSVCAVSVCAVIAVTGCNRRVFEKVNQICDRTLVNDVIVPTEKAADILIVVDNSGSMQEEQDNLARNFFNENANECPLTDLANIPEAFKNPPRALYASGGALSGCGFIQLLAAFDNDFRVGVITTDVGLCDNRFAAGQAGAFCNGAGNGLPECSGSDANNGWGYRPQRGCLQPDGPPDTGAIKVLQRSDLTSGDAQLVDLAGRFKRTLNNIRTFGSSFERGLDAPTMFLDPATNRHPSCANDLETFRRDDASLVVVFLTDEQDCSHGDTLIPAAPDGSLIDENAGETCDSNENAAFRFREPASCYEVAETLPSPASYAAKLRSVFAGVKVAVIAGGVGAPGAVAAEGCRVGGDGAPVGGCYAAQGNSNNPQVCGNTPTDPAVGTARNCSNGSCEIACCQADAGGRYFELASAFEGKSLTDSICNAEFRQTMLDIAAFIAAVDFVELAEAPESENAIIVQVKSADGGKTADIRHLANGDSCSTETGWYLEGERRIVLCGDARPGPGDTVKVRARGANDVNSCGN